MLLVCMPDLSHIATARYRLLLWPASQVNVLSVKTQKRKKIVSKDITESHVFDFVNAICIVYDFFLKSYCSII